MAGDRHAVLARAAALAGPGDRVGVEHAAGCQPDQQVNRLPGQRGGQRGGAVPGVHDDQRRAAPAGAGCLQAAEQVGDLPGGLPGAGGGGGAPGIDQGGPRGAQVPERGGELVLPAGDGLAGAVAAAGVMMDVAASGGAFGVRAGIGGGVDREPQPPPPRARLPDLRGVCGRAGQPGRGPAARSRSCRELRPRSWPLPRRRAAAACRPAARRRPPRRPDRRPARHTARRDRGGNAGTSDSSASEVTA